MNEDQTKTLQALLNNAQFVALLEKQFSGLKPWLDFLSANIGLIPLLADVLNAFFPPLPAGVIAADPVVVLQSEAPAIP